MKDISVHFQSKNNFFTSKTVQQEKHFYWIDWLRFLSAMMVLLVHLRASSFVEYGSLPDNQKNLVFASFYAVTRLGSEAVIVFFVLKGLWQYVKK